MISIELIEPHWVRNEGDDPSDQCAHGYIELAIDGSVLISKEDGPWTVSAAALYLLRSVDRDHSESESVSNGNFIIPCCGFDAYPVEGDDSECWIPGFCPIGINFSVIHKDNLVSIVFEGVSTSITKKEWAEIVFRFACQVASFYEGSQRKQMIEDDVLRQGWFQFWNEWNLLMSAAEAEVNLKS